MDLPAFTRPSKWLLLLESRALLEVGAFFPIRKLLTGLPKGDGHPVIVYRGVMASDLSTVALREVLESLGYVALPWKFGRNLGYSPSLEQLMQEHLERMHEHYGQKVTLVGWSLGGVFARELARAKPECVRQVISMGSPFSGAPSVTNVSWLYDIICGEKISDIDPDVMERIKQPTPVPSTAIYSKSDGIVPWDCCIDYHPDDQHENVRIPGSHFGLGFNPWAIHVIADRLAQPESSWKPFTYEGWRAVTFPSQPRTPEAAAPKSRYQNAGAAIDRLLANMEAKAV